MTTTAAEFTEGGAIRAVIDGREVFVPDDLNNMDRRRIKEEWEDLGNTIAPPPAASTNPNDYQLTRAQVRRMFVEDGKPANFIKSLVSAMPAGKPRERAIVMLEDTDRFPRDHILLTKIVAAGLYTDAQIDTMWIVQGTSA